MRATEKLAEELGEKGTEELRGILSLQLMAIRYELGVMEFFNEKWPHADPGQVGMDAAKLVSRTARIHAVVQELLKRQRFGDVEAPMPEGEAAGG